jgi:hypothetical protein
MNLKYQTYLLLTIAAGFLWIKAQSQNSEPSVQLDVGADSIYIGSQTGVVISIASPSGFLWQWPELVEKLSEKVEIVNQTGIDTIRQRRSDIVMYRNEIRITSFDTGFHAIPPLVFQYRMPGDTLWNTLQTKPFLIYVASPDVDLTLPIRDIKGPVRAPLTFREVVPWLLFAILIAAGIILYLRYIKRKKALPPQITRFIKPKVPPHTLALDALDMLRKEKLWQSGRIKQYHSGITDILRHYLEGRYGIMAVEMTTSEIRDAASSHLLPSHAMGNLFKIFERADLVKFAKSQPLPGEHEESFMLAVEFVRATIPLNTENQIEAGSKNQDIHSNTGSEE